MKGHDDRTRPPREAGVTGASGVTDEQIAADLQVYAGGGMITYQPTVPLGQEWVVGWDGQAVKFTTREGIAGFLAGIQACAGFMTRDES